MGRRVRLGAAWRRRLALHRFNCNRDSAVLRLREPGAARLAPLRI